MLTISSSHSHWDDGECQKDEPQNILLYYFQSSFKENHYLPTNIENNILTENVRNEEFKIVQKAIVQMRSFKNLFEKMQMFENKL